MGKEGVITVEEAKGSDTTLEVVEGMRFDRGYLSPYFITDPERMEVSFEEARLLVSEKRMTSTSELLPLLGELAKTKEPFVILADEIEGSATGEYGDLIAGGVIDPVKVVRCALENAASVAGLMRTTETLIAAGTNTSQEA